MKIPILHQGEILLTSIQEDLTDHDALSFQDDVVQEIAGTEAKGLVIDITALYIVDSFMARVLNETAVMARTMGTEVVLCGMQPAVALTLLQMGRELIGVETALNLNHGMRKLDHLIEERGSDHV